MALPASEVSGKIWRTVHQLPLLLVLLLVAAQALAQPLAPAAEAKASYERGLQLRGKGDPIGSRPHFAAAADAAARANDRALLQAALFSLADVAWDLSDWASMLDFTQRAYDAQPDPKGPARVRYLAHRGRVFQELRERSESFAAYHEAVALARARNDQAALGILYNELGIATWRLERNFSAALKYYDDAIAILRHSNDHRTLMMAFNNSGNLFRNPAGYAEAERRYREGMATGKRGGIEEDAFILKNLGIVLRGTGRRTEAEQMLLRAVHIADTKGNGRIQWQGRMELGTFYATTDVERAVAYYEETLSALEAMNSNMLLEGFRAGAMSGAVTISEDPFDLYIDLLLDHGREREAFSIAERGRARTFLDTLSLAREEIAKALPPEFVAEEGAILERISAGQAALRSPDAGSAKRDGLSRAIKTAEEELRKLRVRLAIEYPALAHARFPKRWSVDDIQAGLLRQDEVLLQYFVGARSTTLWVITPSAIAVRRLAPRDKVETAVRSFLDTLGKPDGNFKADARRLGDLLLPGIEGLLTPASRLIVVPHGILNYVPFEALHTDQDRFLVEAHPVSYAPSTSSLAFLRSRSVAGTELLALGNPVMRGSGSATERNDAIKRVSALKPLEHSGPEVRAVASLYGASARVFEQESATEAALFTGNASRAGIIHIATHGLIDEEMPERSGLALTAAPPESDGILQMREIYKLRLNAALVTLSACQTALGKSVTGEGMVGLQRAFFYAGSNAVLASLWNVNDASTEQLMRPFYRSLADGGRIDDALRAAKLTLLTGGGRFSHPYYWAAFVVTGHGAAPVAVRPVRTTWTLWGGGLATAMVLLGILAWRRGQ